VCKHVITENSKNNLDVKTHAETQRAGIVSGWGKNVEVYAYRVVLWKTRLLSQDSLLFVLLGRNGQAPMVKEGREHSDQQTVGGLELPNRRRFAPNFATMLKVST
jgi:hypothetical protein